jgi:hypothetical protein
MPTRFRRLALAVLLVALAGCAGNYRSSDNDYRPLGDPETVNRGN